MRNLRFIKSDGTYPTADANGVTTLAGGGAIYYAELEREKLQYKGTMSVHWKYDGTIVASIVIEGTNFQEAKITDATNSGWASQPPATVSPAASAGESLSSWADVGVGRLRAKVTVTTGGDLRGAFNCKQ